MKEPKVPKLKQISVQKEQQRAIEGNVAAMEPLKTLGGDVNKFIAEQQAAQMETLFPGMGAVRSKATEELLSGLSGELPKDVQDLIARRAVERGISSGTAGSQFAQFGELGTLGLTSLDRIQSSLNSALQWSATAQAGLKTFDPTAFFISPEFQTNVAISERDKAFNVAWTRNQISAQYAPGTIAGKAMMKAGDEFVQILNTLVGSVGGAVGGAIMSDRSLKENVTTVDEEVLLEKIGAMPIGQWNYKTDPDEYRHIGPMAQDFNKSLGVANGDDNVIHYVDLGGVALAAIKGLLAKVKNLTAEVEQLKQRI